MKCFLGDAGALLRRHEAERAHIVQPVSELHEEYAKIRCDGEDQLAEILALGRLFRHEVEPLDLGQAIDERTDLRAEDAVDLVQRRGRVLDRIVQHGRHDGGGVELQVGEDRRHFERMGDDGRRRRASACLRAHGVDIGAVEQVLITFGS